MAFTETLRPNAAGDECNIDLTNGAACPNHYQNVDEATGYSTYVRTHSGSYLRDLYAVENSSVGEGNIQSVIVYAVCLDIGEGQAGYVKIALKSGGTVGESSEQNLSGTWTTKSNTWSTPPEGGSWDWDKIDAMQIGVSLKTNTGVEDAYCTQVYAVVNYTKAFTASLTASMGMTAVLTRGVVAHTRSNTATIGLKASLTREVSGYRESLCVASQDGGSTRTHDGGANWESCAQVATGALGATRLTQHLNRLCALEYENMGFSYSDVNDIDTAWTNKPYFPNLPQKFTDMFVGRDAGDDPALYFLTPTGMYYLDVFSNFVFGPTELTWEYDSLSGKKGMYWKGSTYVAVNKGIYQVTGGVVSLVGPDMDDGLSDDLQGTITDMIGVGFWLVIAIDGGASHKSSILKRYITGKHWHPVYVGSKDTPIRALFWDSGTLYFGEGKDVKTLKFPAITDNVRTIPDHTYGASGTLTYPWFHSPFEAMPKVAHKLWAVTEDCNTSETITVSYRKDSETTWTELGSFKSSPKPTALPFPASGKAKGISFERIQFKVAYARVTSTNSPKIVSLVLEYRVVPPVLWGFDVKVIARTQGDQTGDSIIAALTTAIGTATLLSFYPSGDKSGTEYLVEVKGMPHNIAGTEFGTEGLYSLSLGEVVD